MGSVGGFKRQLKKLLTRCEVADDPVVVRKSWPEKPGNRVEEKTATTSGKAAAVTAASFDGRRRIKSSSVDAKG
jgi:hypothetical protein